MAKLRLFWPVDIEGYRLESAKPVERRKPVERKGLLSRGWPVPAKTLLEKDEPKFTSWIVRKGGRLDFQDRCKGDGLWRQLADTKPTEEGAVTFVRRFGFLHTRGRRESVAFICEQIKVMRSIVDAIKREDWAALDLWLLDHGKAIRLRPVFHQQEGWLRPDLFFAPNTLLDAIYLRALQDATSGTDLRKCHRPGCPEYRAVGPGTGRWRTNRPANRPVFYCTPKCQKAHAYMKLKGESK